MFKRKSLIFCIAVVAIVCLFMPTGVLAQCVSPECLTINSSKCELELRAVKVDDAFPVVISDATEIPTAISDISTEEEIRAVCNDIFPCTLFAYRYNDEADCNYSQMALALPNPLTYCSDNLWEVTLASVPSDEWQDPGDGDTNTGWYKYDYAVRVLEAQPKVGGFYFATTKNVSAHPAPVMIEVGNLKYYGTLLAPSCWMPPPPAVAVSAVSTSTPEGCTLTVSQALTGPVATYDCGPGNTGTATPYDTDQVYLGFPMEDCGDDGVSFDGLDDEPICAFKVKFNSDNSYGRIGAHSIGWYYWNGKWYSYTY